MTGSVGGEYNHTLTLDEMPQHMHHVYLQNTSNNPQVDAPKWTIAFPNSWKQYTSDTMLFGANTKGQGNDVPHNNLSPYTAVYFWKRIS